MGRGWWPSCLPQGSGDERRRPAGLLPAERVVAADAQPIEDAEVGGGVGGDAFVAGVARRCGAVAEQRPGEESTEDGRDDREQSDHELAQMYCGDLAGLLDEASEHQARSFAAGFDTTEAEVGS